MWRFGKIKDEEPRAKVLFDETLSPQGQDKDICSVLLTFIQYYTGSVDHRKEARTRKSIYTGKEEIKLYLYMTLSQTEKS